MAVFCSSLIQWLGSDVASPLASINNDVRPEGLSSSLPIGVEFCPRRSPLSVPSLYRLALRCLPLTLVERPVSAPSLGPTFMEPAAVSGSVGCVPLVPVFGSPRLLPGPMVARSPARPPSAFLDASLLASFHFAAWHCSFAAIAMLGGADKLLRDLNFHSPPRSIFPTLSPD